MRALCVRTVGFSLSKPYLTSSFPCQRFLCLLNNSSSISITSHHNLSTHGALLPRRLSDSGLWDTSHLFDRISQRERHNHVVRWTSLITKYAKAGFVDEARALFEVIPERNIVTYNAMLTGYVKCGRLVDAWALFRGMPKNVVSWTVMLCGLCEDGRIDEAVELFEEMPERNIVSWNSLVAGLIRNGDMERAKHVFDVMPCRNVISWNAMISGYVENCRMEEARMLFEKMGERNVVTWTSMIAGYSRAGDVLEGYRLFQKMPGRNIVSWTAMIGGFAWNEFYKESLLLFLEMKKHLDVKPNGETFVSLAYACAGVCFHRLGKQLHAQVIANGWDHVDDDGRLSKSLIHMYASFGLMGSARYVFSKNFSKCDLQSFNFMINGYLRTGCLEEAQNLFKKVQNLKDKVSWTSMMDGYLNAGEISKAFDLFHEIPGKDRVTWTVMISGLVHNELFGEATCMFSEMLVLGLQPLNSTYSVLFGAAGCTANLDQGKQLHCMITKTMYEFDLILENSLISMYAKCGAIDDAYRVFSNMVYRDLVSWNSMIMGFSHHGLAVKALELFNEMLDSGTNPNSITFLAVLSACSHSGLISRGFELFNEMKNMHNIQPTSEHFISMINLLGRAGKLREAEEFISTLPFTPDHTFYGALLSSCGIKGKDTEMAKRAAKRLLELDPLNAPGHVALCNVYARNGKRLEEHWLRKEMGVKGVKKVAGCSWVLVNAKAHVFLSGDTLSSTSQLAQLILPLLCGLPEKQETGV